MKKMVCIVLTAWVLISCGDNKADKKRNAIQKTAVTDLKAKIAQKPDSIGFISS
jgi:hypothetical protein